MFDKMSKSQTLRGLINQRLSLAAEEIFELFERTIAEYEEQLCRSKEENERQQKLLEAVYDPQTEVHQLFVSEDEVPPEPQRRILDQEDPSEPVHVKKEELWSRQEGDQLQGPEQTDTSILLFDPVSVKSENYAQNRNTEHLNPDIQSVPAHRETSHPESETDDSSTEPQSGSNPQNESPGSDELYYTKEASTSSGRKEQLQGIHTGQKPFVCSVCGRGYGSKKGITSHMIRHMKTRHFSCSVCVKTFPKKEELVRHIRVHTGERPYSCSLCGKSFTQKSSLMSHQQIHTGERPFGCLVCGKRFARRTTLKRHMIVHAGKTLLSL